MNTEQFNELIETLFGGLLKQFEWRIIRIL
jgi:hypothetical protein